jgi:hypothetical protein
MWVQILQDANKKYRHCGAGLTRHFAKMLNIINISHVRIVLSMLILDVFAFFFANLT